MDVTQSRFSFAGRAKRKRKDLTQSTQGKTGARREKQACTIAEAVCAAAVTVAAVV